MQKNMILSAIPILCLFGCNSGSDSNRVRSQAIGGQAAFDVSLSDYSPSQSLDGKRAIFISRRGDSVAKVMTFATERAPSEMLAAVDVQATEADVSLASLSPDGEKIIATVRDDNDALVLLSFDGSKKLQISDEDLQGFRMDRLSWSPDSKVFAVGGQKLSEDGSIERRIWLALVDEANNAYTVQFSEAQEGIDPVIADQDKLSFRSTAGDQIMLLTYSHDGQEFSFTGDQSVTVDPGLAERELFFADQSRVYTTTTQSAPRVRTRWGNRQPSEDGVDNIGKMSITQVVNGFQLDQLNPAEDLRFAAYEVYEPANIFAMDSTRNGEILLLVGQQYIACEKFSLNGNQMLLVHTGLQTVFPLVPLINGEKQVTGLVSDPCTYVDQDQPASNQPFDFRIQNATIEEIAPGEFSVVYQSRLWSQPEIYQATITLPNLETPDLVKEDLDISGEVVNVSNNFE